MTALTLPPPTDPIWREAQTPTFSSRAEEKVSGHGAAAIDWLSNYGVVLDEWQEWLLIGWLATRTGGKFRYGVCGASIPRQNGKNEVILARAIYGAVVLGERILISAHQVKTNKKTFRRIAFFFERPDLYPDLAAELDRIQRVNGEEGIYLRNGGSVEFVARAGSSARGFTVDGIIFDEAQEIGADALESILPTMASGPRRNGQTVYLGTPPPPGVVSGDTFRGIRAAALQGSKTTCWDEWSITTLDWVAPDLDDRRLWARLNPAAETRLQESVIEGERGAMSDAGFSRERCGDWGLSQTTALIAAETWDLQYDENSAPADRRALAVVVSMDRDSAAVVAAGVREDGLWHVEVLESRTGTAWAPAYVRERLDAMPGAYRAVVVDGYGPTAPLIPALTALKIRPTVIGVGQVCDAAMGMYDSLHSGGVFHVGQSQLTRAWENCARRKVGERWALGPKSADIDITPAIGSTLALWGSRAPVRNVKKPMAARNVRSDGATGKTRRAVIMR